MPARCPRRPISTNFATRPDRVAVGADVVEPWNGNWRTILIRQAEPLPHGEDAPSSDVESEVREVHFTAEQCMHPLVRVLLVCQEEIPHDFLVQHFNLH
jgi:hypothetical protein